MNGSTKRCHNCHKGSAPPARTKAMTKDTQPQQAAAALRMTKAKVKGPAKARTKTRKKGTSPATNGLKPYIISGKGNLRMATTTNGLKPYIISSKGNLLMATTTEAN